MLLYMSQYIFAIFFNIFVTFGPVNARTNVATPAGEYHTNVERVFTAGDMHRGQSLVVWAIREGREAAQEIDVSLMGYTNMNVQ